MPFVTRSGKLEPQFLPAMYFDSSVLIDYWMTEGLEIERPASEIERMLEDNEPKDVRVVRELLKSDRRIQKVIEIRKKCIFGKARVVAVISPLCLLELMEWKAETAFKDAAAEAAGPMFVQKRGKKEVGEYLRRLLQLKREEEARLKGKTRHESTGLDMLMGDTWLNRSFAECHGLSGLLQADIVNFKLTIGKAWAEPSAYSYLQLGLSDILHILTAQHLGCAYLASFDSDFQRATEIIEEETKMKVLNTPEEVLKFL